MMTGLPSTMVVEPLKIATLSYHLSFQIETGRRAHLTKSRETQWPQSCARASAPVRRHCQQGCGAGGARYRSLAGAHLRLRLGEVVLVHQMVHAVDGVVERPCRQRRSVWPSPRSGQRQHGDERGRGRGDGGAPLGSLMAHVSSERW